MWYKLKRIMMRPNGVEKQVYPKTRNPWANTIAYYPLTSSTTVNDMSGNSKNLTNYWATFWTYQWVDCAAIYDRTKYISWDISTSVTGANPRTYNFWVYNSRATAYWEEKYFFNGVEYNTNQMVLFFIDSWNDTVSQWGSWASFWTALRQQWINLCLVYDGSKFTLYRNWTQEWNSWTYTINTQGTTLRLWWPRVSWDSWWDKFEWYMSRFIFEDKARTAQEVADYYNLTKSNYWL